MRLQARDGLATWWAERMDELIFVYLSGARGVDTTLTLPIGFTGHAGNALNTPIGDTGHFYSINAHAKVAVTSSDIMTLAVVDKLVEMAETVDPMIQPIMVDGEKTWILLMHPYQATALRATSGSTWLAIETAATARMGHESNIFKNALGMYRGVVMHSHRNVVRFSDYGGSYNLPAARALFLGAQAGAIAFGKGGSEGRYSWVEELFDYDNQLGVAAGSILGVKKTMFNSAAFGVIACDTYAIAAT
jgi:N4-gp56 family major capsid protein